MKDRQYPLHFSEYCITCTLITILFARRDSIYKTLPDTDVWDIDRDATRWLGGTPIVTHPPCRLWGRLRQFSTAPPAERDLACWAVKQVRQWGGVLEHPASSTLWPFMGLPSPGKHDAFGGWTLPVQQHWWGHRARKATWLYIMGCNPRDIPPIPLCMDEPTHVVKSYKPGQPHITKAEREHTPLALAQWLIEVARRCSN